LNKREKPVPLIARILPLTPVEEEALHQLDLETLCRFFSNPARFLLQQRLGIYLDKTSTLTDKREDFELNFLDKYLVGQNMVHSKLKGRDLDDYRPLQLAMGQLPHAPGWALFIIMICVLMLSILSARLNLLRIEKLRIPWRRKLKSMDFGYR
jgi:exonuclease V gamma subunit